MTDKDHRVCICPAPRWSYGLRRRDCRVCGQPEVIAA